MTPPLWSKDTRVFVDTSSLMEDASALFMWNLAGTLREKGLRPLIVARSVAEELNRLTSHKNEVTSRKAQDAIGLVESLRNEENAEIVGRKDDGEFADNLFQTIFTQLRLKYRLVLITQDRSLAKDILSLNSSASVERILGIDALRIEKSGKPRRWDLDASHPSGVREAPQHWRPDIGPPSVEKGARSNPKETPPPSATSFELRDDVTQLDDTPIVITSVPGPGDTVRDAEGVLLRLGDMIGSGGEGKVYEIDSERVCKVYNRGRLKQATTAKLNLMTSRRIRHPAICWPLSPAFNSLGETVGYLMPKAKGKELQRVVFIPPLLQKTFPHWTRQHLVKLTATILDAVAYLHSLNVLLGDINARNILVQDESTVFFVDCDSYQVEGFPCPVGMPPYLAPELYGKEFRSTLRTLEHEYFAIATLVFMLLHPGKPPYSHQGGGDPSKNVHKQLFPYQRGGQRARRAPKGAWRFMFSHLPRNMKDAFHEVFSDGKRLPITTWLYLIDRYERNLSNGYVSDELFPKGFKQLTKDQAEQSGIPWRDCEVCGRGFAAFSDHFTRCYNCS